MIGPSYIPQEREGSPLSIDVTQYIDAVVREVRSCEYQGKPARVVVVRRSYPTSVDDLWDAVTNPERLPRWFLPVSGDLRLGGRFQIEGNAGGEITACDRPSSLSATWEFGGGISWVTVRLSPASGGAELELEHTAHVEGDLWDQFGPGAVGVGRDLALAMGLAMHITTGEQVDPQTALAWPQTDEGKAFIARCSDDWARASIADGTDEAVARAAAALTTAFYT